MSRPPFKSMAFSPEAGDRSIAVQMLVWASVLVWCLLSIGCSAPPIAPSTLTLDPGSYDRSFDAVLMVARENDMPAVLRDRVGGVIETAPRLAGSIFEPWRLDNASLSEGVANTVSLQRRRARFEFVPADFDPPSAGDPSRLEGPPLPGSRKDDLLDMEQYEGPLEVRIWVYIERAFTPGVRSGSWTRSQTTFARDPLVPSRGDGDELMVDFSRWTPVRRDPAYEQRFREALGRQLAGADPSGS